MTTARTQRAYRFTYRGQHMPHAAVRFLSTALRAEHVRQQFAKMGLQVSTVTPVWISQRRQLDDAKYFPQITAPGLLSAPDHFHFTPARQGR